ncbi:MAG: alginate export family protein, partial [Candidatus Ratteibacteria bacterium]
NLTVGRQEIQMGNGLVVGAGNYQHSVNPINAADLRLEKAFDAIKLDYAFTAAPVTVCAFKSKITENYASTTSDTDLYGLDVVLKAENLNLSVNPYYVNYTQAATRSNILHTAGLSIGWNPMEALNIAAEYAKQFGEDKTLSPTRDYEGWALCLGVDYKFATNMNPVVSAMYADFSGKKSTATDNKNWVPVFPSNIESRVGKIAYPALFSNGEGSYNIGTGSGVRVFKLGLGLQPTEKVGVALDWFNLTAKETDPGIDDSVGNEIDLSINYAYSEDLSVGIELGYFINGNYIEDTVGSNNDKSPWQAIATMKIAF